ncbi:chromate transporter [Leucobacter soli]|uniref:chromate transporter n=1 Tax=Leucobacter soli TaxID=2812850 RepID=UPI003621895C
MGVSRKTGITALAVFGCLLACLPVLAALTQNAWVGIADAFTRAGAFVFGGGHVVLPLLQAEPAIASSIVLEQFLAGYGAAQAVPGPLFTFAAYLGFDMVSGPLAPVAALLALVAVFVPGLLLLVAALPFWDRVPEPERPIGARGRERGRRRDPRRGAVDPGDHFRGHRGRVLGIAAACFLLLTVWKLPAWVAVLLGAVAGVVVAATGVSLAWA